MISWQTTPKVRMVSILRGWEAGRVTNDISKSRIACSDPVGEKNTRIQLAHQVPPSWNNLKSILLPSSSSNSSAVWSATTRRPSNRKRKSLVAVMLKCLQYASITFSILWVLFKRKLVSTWASFTTVMLKWEGLSIFSSFGTGLPSRGDDIVGGRKVIFAARADIAQSEKFLVIRRWEDFRLTRGHLTDLEDCSWIVSLRRLQKVFPFIGSCMRSDRISDARGNNMIGVD